MEQKQGHQTLSNCTSQSSYFLISREALQLLPRGYFSTFFNYCYYIQSLLCVEIKFPRGHLNPL